MKRAIAAAVVLVVGSLVVFVVLDRPAPQEPENDAIERAEAFYQTREPFERPRPHTEVPDGLASLDAKACGACHQEIYKEWAVSTHRRAWTDDAQFMAELAKSRGEHGDSDGDVGWLCVNCHTPLMNQLPELVVGLEDGELHKPIYVDNPEFSESLQHDAITCASCHVRDGIVYGPYGDGEHAPHPVAKDERLLTEEVCTDCHQAEMIYQEQVLGCFFSTGKEWAASTHGVNGATCQSCHMPEVERKVAEAFDVPVRKTRRHWFGGSLIPKKPEFEEELKPLRDVYPTGVELQVKLEKPDAEPFDVEALAEVDRELYDEARIECEGECTRHYLIATNVAGHRMPSGDPERHVDLSVSALDEEGTVLSSVWYRLNSRYQWWPNIEQLSDTRLNPDEVRVLPLDVPKKAVRLRVVGEKFRMYQGAFDYHELDGEYVRGRTFLDTTLEVVEGQVESGPLKDTETP